MNTRGNPGRQPPPEQPARRTTLIKFPKSGVFIEIAVPEGFEVNDITSQSLLNHDVSILEFHRLVPLDTPQTVRYVTRDIILPGQNYKLRVTAPEQVSLEDIFML